jgi:hypothetical protein
MGRRHYGRTPSEQATIQEAITYRRRGLTLRDTAEVLNTLGYRNQNGGEWNTCSVHRDAGSVQKITPA